MKIDAPYGITRRIPATDAPAARARMIDALREEGFGVLTEIDVRETLKKKLDVDVGPYVILGACNPGLAKRALGHEPAIGLLLPCNVVVTEDAGDAVVSAASPRAMFAIVEGASPELRAVGDEAETRLRRAIERA